MEEQLQFIKEEFTKKIDSDKVCHFGFRQYPCSAIDSVFEHLEVYN